MPRALVTVRYETTHERSFTKISNPLGRIYLGGGGEQPWGGPKSQLRAMPMVGGFRGLRESRSPGLQLSEPGPSHEDCAMDVRP